MKHKPLGLIFLASILVLLPCYVLGHAVLVHFSGPGGDGLFAFLWRVLFRERPDLVAILIACAVTGIGLFYVKRWAFYGFIGLATLVVVMVIARAILDGVWNIPGIGLSVALLVGGTYMLRRDLSRPYLAALPRGFREGARRSISFRVVLRGAPDPADVAGSAGQGSTSEQPLLEGRTLDLSTGGCFIPSELRLDDPDRELELELIFPDGDSIKMPAWPARLIPAQGKQPAGLGIRFEADGRQKGIIRDRIRVYYSPRYGICTEIKIITDTGDINGYTYNLSAQGAFVEQPDGDLPARDSRALAMIDLGDEHLEIPVRVSWLNANLVPEKPRGFGVEFTGSADLAKRVRAFVRRHGRKYDVIR